MDKVKLGRAFGYGARHAVKTMAQAVDAATSPTPRPAAERINAVRKPAGEAVAQVVGMAQQVHRAKHEAKKQAKNAVLGPVKKFSSVVLLQVTGCFFGLFALTMAAAIAKHHADFSKSWETAAGRNVYFYVAAMAVFGYFSVSNFVRARKRERE
ncbi:MAG: hypothetical protein ABI142_08305 [Bryocella sp.]